MIRKLKDFSLVGGSMPRDTHATYLQPLAVPSGLFNSVLRRLSTDLTM